MVGSSSMSVNARFRGRRAMNARPTRLQPWLAAALVFLAVSGPARTAGAADAPPQPVTPKRPVFDTYQGVKVEDDYRWLEDGHDPSVRAWSDSQNVVARDWLDHAPGRKDILERVTALNQSLTPHYSKLMVCGGLTFALKEAPPKQQDMVVALR